MRYLMINIHVADVMRKDEFRRNAIFYALYVLNDIEEWH